MSQNFSYPLPGDTNFLHDTYVKREFYANKIQKREKLEEYSDIKKYRDGICKGEFKLREQQLLLKNFISPDNPYKGILIMHGTGTGKTCTAISIAEQFKDQVKKYNTKIFILTFGPNNRETFKSELLFCTGETYLKNKFFLNKMTKNDIEREKKIAIYNALQYYRILSYKTFYKKVLGEKIVEKKVTNENKIVSSYKKDTSGNIEREVVIDKINNMNNSIIIVDEAHNLTGNEYGEALKKIIRSSENLKVILLSATPMKNLADDIIDILNFIRPQDNPIKRDLVFTSERNYDMNLKNTGAEYFKKMAKGYISYFRGNMPFTFADRVDKGEIPDELLFTPLIRCKMEKFQLETYKKTKENIDDTLERSSSAVANFVFPGLNTDKSKLEGYYSTDGFNKFINEFRNNKKKILDLINAEIFNKSLDKNILENFIKETDNLITGEILNIKYLKYFSTKFYECIKNLNKINDMKEGSGTLFVYSNLVKAGGIELFAECLKENGYLQYNEDSSSYIINNNTLDAITGKTFEEFKKRNINLKTFYPATFILITGGGDDNDDIPEIKQKIIREIFNNIENKNGKLLKIVLGSKVMNEGVTLENVKEVHILDVHYNLNKVEQVIGRAIRMCKHQNVINDKNRFPKVNVYRYVITLKNKLTSDENLYRKAELKFLLVKKIERLIKTIAIDCPLLINGNKFPEEIEKYKKCVYPTLENKKKGKLICPAICDFEECDFKCDDKKLNEKYYDKKNNTYVDLKKKNVDYNTFTDELANSEITLIKSIIKDLYKFNYVYIYDEILKNILLVYNEIQKEIFDNYFLDKALKDLMPESENDFNNFKDTLFDKFNRIGYLIKRNKYYIFQPFDEHEDLPIYYRKNLNIKITNDINLKYFLLKKYGKVEGKKDVKKKTNKYKFNKDYYQNRNENFIVGIIDKNSSGEDVFKIRPPIVSSNKRRGTGIYSLTGAVCATSKDKDYLLKQLRKLDSTIKLQSKIKRSEICNEIKKALLRLEKFSTKKDKITYIVIPQNHKDLEFPYNLEDRVKYLIKQIDKASNAELKYEVKKYKTYFELIVKDNKNVKESILKTFNFTKNKKEYVKKLI